MKRLRLHPLTPVALVLCVAALTPRPATAAATKVEGEYQLMLDTRKDQRFFPWDWDSNNNDNWTGAQLRLFSVPRSGVEAFLKVEADWSDPNNNTPRPVFQYREAHVRYRWDLGGKGFDSYLFSRQDRFWVDNYLIKVVESGPLTDGGNAQGVRVDSWGFWGVNASVIASDFSSQFNPVNPVGNPSRGSVDKTDDAYVVRLRREFLDQKALRLGFTYNRKNENQINETVERAEVFAVDSRYTWAGPKIGPIDLSSTDLALEYAESRSPITTVTYPDARDRRLTFFRKSTGIHLPDRGVLVGEIRTVRLGTPEAGYLNVAPVYWTRGPLYDNRAGDSNRDETGFTINTWYLLPDRAITLTNNYTRYRKRAFEKREDTEYYNEVYIEFVNGFTGKSYYRQHETVRGEGLVAQTENHDDWFNELQVESRLAWLRVQSKVKDVGTPLRKQLYSIETRLNLTDKLQLYNRFAFGNDPSILRKGLFSQLRYRPTGNMEMYVQYGPTWIGDSSTPVDDGDLEGGGDQTDIFQFILKGSF